MGTDVDPPRYPTPTGEPCPRCLRVDGTVEGSGACLGCGTCLLFGGLLDAVYAAKAAAESASHTARWP